MFAVVKIVVNVELIEWYDNISTINPDSLAQHKENIVKNLELHRGSPRMWAKY